MSKHEIIIRLLSLVKVGPKTGVFGIVEASRSWRVKRSRGTGPARSQFRQGWAKPCCSTSRTTLQHHSGGLGIGKFTKLYLGVVRRTKVVVWLRPKPQLIESREGT